MHHIFTLALVEKSHVSVLDALPHLAGMLMVMVTLTILWGVCAFTAKMVRLITPAPAAPVITSTAAPEAKPVPPSVPEGIAPEIVAVIAAAVTIAAGKNHRIISIKPQSTGWEKAGRQSVLSSHRIR